AIQSIEAAMYAEPTQWEDSPRSLAQTVRQVTSTFAKHRSIRVRIRVWWLPPTWRAGPRAESVRSAMTEQGKIQR
ncbi:MAG: hypothetical protein ABI137_15850, partial [Antricoccus sp.]